LPLPYGGYPDEQASNFKRNFPAVEFVDMARANSRELLAAVPRPLWRRLVNRALHLIPTEPPFRAAWTKDYLGVVAAALTEAISAGAYDVIQFEHSELASWSSLVQWPGYRVLDFHDVVYSELCTYKRTQTSRLGRLETIIECRKFMTYERTAARRFDLCLVVSETERERLVRIQPRARVSVIPNGVDTAYFGPSFRGYDPYRLVFTGSMSHSPNVDAMTFFCREMLPLVRERMPEVRLDIVGLNPAPAVRVLEKQYPRVRVTGAVVDVRPYILDAAVYVAPITSGGGTRLKILEALACGKAVVATRFACNGLQVHDGANILLRDDPEGFAEAIIDLLGDPAKVQRLGRAGRELVVGQFDWTVVGERLFDAYQKLSHHSTQFLPHA